MRELLLPCPLCFSSYNFVQICVVQSSACIMKWSHKSELLSTILPMYPDRFPSDSNCIPIAFILVLYPYCI